MLYLFLFLNFAGLSAFGEKAPPLPPSSLADKTAEAQALPKPPGLAESLLAASLIVQLAFLVLLIMSVVSWAVILQKGMTLKKTKEENRRLSGVFLRNSSFEDIYKLARANEQSSLARIFNAGYEEMTKVLAAAPAKAPAPPPQAAAQAAGAQAAFPAGSASGPQTAGAPLFSGGEDNIERALRKEIQTELAYMESGLGFLATAGNSCPFIGLFGTVFGIMDAFGKIAATGSAGLAVVAPGIAEALFATGLGLFAAIPAAVFYNLYISRLKKFEMEFSNFAADFVNIAKRNFFMPRR